MSLRRRAVSAVRLVGARATDLGRVGVLVTRGPNRHVRALSKTVTVVGTEETEVAEVGTGAWLVQRRGGRPGVRTRRLAGGSTLVTPRGGGATVRQVGQAGSTHLVLDPEAMRADLRRVELSLSHYLAGEHAAWMLRELGITCVLDAGANRGQFAASIRAAGYTGRIVSYEPLPHLVAELEAAAAGDPEWHVVGCALGEVDEETVINVVPGTMSSLLPASDFGRAWDPVLGEMQPQPVSVRRLDGLFDEAVAGLEHPRVYLKMDTQGFDVATFRGAGERIAAVLGMQSEVSCVPIYDGMPRMQDQLAMYEAAGFELTGLFPVTIDRRSLRAIEFDAFLVRPEAVAPDEHRP